MCETISTLEQAKFSELNILSSISVYVSQSYKALKITRTLDHVEIQYTIQVGFKFRNSAPETVVDLEILKGTLM